MSASNQAAAEPAGREGQQSNPILHHETKDLHIVEHECQYAADMSRGRIVVEHGQQNQRKFRDAIEELAGTDSRNLALRYAVTVGIADARLNGNVEGPYAVNEDGTELENVAAKHNHGQPLPPDHPKMQPAKYRVTVPVTRRLI